MTGKHHAPAFLPHMSADALGYNTAAATLAYTTKQGCLLTQNVEIDITAGLVMTPITIMLRFPGHNELGTCRASLVFPEQPVLSIPVMSIDTTVLTVT
jgi:hypothetical protein